MRDSCADGAKKHGRHHGLRRGRANVKRTAISARTGQSVLVESNNQGSPRLTHGVKVSENVLHLHAIQAGRGVGCVTGPRLKGNKQEIDRNDVRRARWIRLALQYTVRKKR